MSDARLIPSNGRVAHVSLRGKVEAEQFTEGTAMRVAVPVAPLFDGIAPDQWNRNRELLLHEGFQVLEEGEGWAFGFALRDSYVGYMRRDALCKDFGPLTHIICTRQSYLFPEPALKSSADIRPIYFGTLLTPGDTFENGRWSEVTLGTPDGGSTQTRYVPTAHLRHLQDVPADPVAIAELFLGTPYLWGGNSGFGIDCSGLVQAAFLACGIPCPGDSDLQEATLGSPLAKGAVLRRGDLVFWKGHVALCVDKTTLIHANATDMAVAYEGIEQAITRIEAQGEGPVNARKRVARQR